MTGAFQWFRSYHGTANDPKWGTVVARCHAMSRHVTPNEAASRQVTTGACRIRKGDVISVWQTMQELASQSSVRGTMEGWNAEDVATNLELTEAEVQLIFDAMQGKVLEGLRLLAWDKRQPKREREDPGAAERKSRQRDKGHAMSRHVTPEPAESRPREEKRREEEKRKSIQYSVDTLSQEPTRGGCKTPEERAREFELLDDESQADLRAFYEHVGGLKTELPVTLSVFARFLAHVRECDGRPITSSWHKQLLMGMINATARQIDIDDVFTKTIEARLSRPLWDQAPKSSAPPQGGFDGINYSQGMPK